MVSVKPQIPMAELIKRRFNRMMRGDFKPMISQNCDIVINDIVNHINSQAAIDDAPLKRNSESTLKVKARLGKGSLSLIWEKLLSDRRSYLKKVDKMTGEITRSESVSRLGKSVNYSEVGGYLQDKGYNFWGISKQAQTDMLANEEKYVRDQLGGVR